jgi:hypothetical protein
VSSDAEAATDEGPFMRIAAGRLDDDELVALVVALTTTAATCPAPTPTRPRPVWVKRFAPRTSGWQARSAARPGVPAIR